MPVRPARPGVASSSEGAVRVVDSLEARLNNRVSLPEVTVMNRHAWLLVLTSLLVSCQDSLPTAPSDVTAGLTLYEHANYEGESALVTRSIADLADFKGPCEHPGPPGPTYSPPTYDWSDCISSVRIAPGWRAVLYKDTNYRGRSLEVLADVPNLQLVPGDCSHDGLNDCVSSIRIDPPEFR
jgi:hypothetical protein